MAAIDAPVVKEAIRLAGRYRISYFDAQIIAAAKSVGCSKLYSEDLSHGQAYDGVFVTNPFAVGVP